MSFLKCKLQSLNFLILNTLIIQGGMHYVGFAELAAAVSNAGGLGIITALNTTSADDLKNEI